MGALAADPLQGHHIQICWGIVDHQQAAQRLHQSNNVAAFACPQQWDRLQIIHSANFVAVQPDADFVFVLMPMGESLSGRSLPQTAHSADGQNGYMFQSLGYRRVNFVSRQPARKWLWHHSARRFLLPNALQIRKIRGELADHRIAQDQMVDQLRRDLHRAPEIKCPACHLRQAEDRTFEVLRDLRSARLPG
ncbi:hypothetical protein ASD12_31740 [Mesorhizobium sp. Root102]|nr:hypothetical protein ASD12_31740 [Mesorhizobium sp. Root102]